MVPVGLLRPGEKAAEAEVKVGWGYRKVFGELGQVDETGGARV
jgi:hypothetical protein